MEGARITTPPRDARVIIVIKNDSHTHVDGISAIIIVPSVHCDRFGPICTVHMQHRSVTHCPDLIPSIIGKAITREGRIVTPDGLHVLITQTISQWQAFYNVIN
jgi:hypothetical protein